MPLHTASTFRRSAAITTCGWPTIIGCCLATAVMSTIGCGGPAEPLSRDDALRQQLGLELLGAISYPDDNRRSDQRIALGRLLFYDPILGGEQDVACGTCHHPQYNFTDARQFAAGVSGVGLGPDRHLGVSAISGAPISTASRNAPTVLNTAFVRSTATHVNGGVATTAPMFWDGRANGLEGQALVPITSRAEMRGDAFPNIEATEGYLPGSPQAADATLDSILQRIRGVPEYVQMFRDAFAGDQAAIPEPINRSTLSRAIAAYERELVAVNSPFDRWLGGDDTALSETQKLGLELFYNGVKCATCHVGPMLSNFNFMVIGAPQEGPGMRTIAGDDTGREEVTRNATDRYQFRVPSLRNVAITAPYTHSGVFDTLDEVVRFYNAGVQPRHPNARDDMVNSAVRQPLGLTDPEISALLSFLQSLTDTGADMDPLLTTVPASVPSGLQPVFGAGGN